MGNQILSANPTEVLDQLQGIYRGFSPTDESPIVMGELEISINQESLKSRFATGLNITEEEIPISRFKPMTKEELIEIYEEGSDYANRSIGFSVNGINCVFLPDPSDDEFGLIVRGNEMADLLGPTLLYSPAQIERGVYDKAIARANAQFTDKYPQGCFPRLETNGKLPE